MPSETAKASLGYVTSYGAAKRGGYQGSYEEWCALMAEVADHLEQNIQLNEDSQAAKAMAVLAEQEAETAALNAEAWAKGTKAGSSVPSTDPAYHDNAKYYSEVAGDQKDQAEQAASSAAGSAETAEGHSTDAEAWAAGTRGGEEVESGDDAYQNNAKYFSEQSAGSATEAAGFAETAEGWATGGSGGTAGAQNNAKYYSQQAASSAQTAAAMGTNFAPEFSSSTPYSAGDYVLYQGTLYRFTADHAAGAWVGTDAAAEKIAPVVSDLKESFIDLGYNLVNVANETLVEGKIINGSNNVSANSTNESREIRIAAGKFKKIYIKAGTNNTIFAFLTATIGTYSSGQSISDIFASGENTRRVITHGTSEEFYIPTDCTVISFNIAASGNDYTPEFVCLCTEDGVIDRVINEAINTIKTASKNLYDKYSATNQRGLNPNTGETAANNDYIVSDFIPVEAGETYVVSCGDGTEDLHLRYAFYNVNHVFISGGYYKGVTYTNYFTTPNNTAFVKIAVYNTLQNIQLEKGQTPTYFVPHLSVKDLTSDLIISPFVAARNTWDVTSGSSSYPGWAVYDSPLSTPIASFTSEDGATYDSVNARWTLGLGQSIQIPVPTEAGELYHISIYFKDDDPEHDFIYQQHTQNPLTISLGNASETIFFGPDVLGNIDLMASASASDTLFKIKMAETAGGIIRQVRIRKILKLPEAIAKLNDNKITAVYRNIAKVMDTKKCRAAQIIPHLVCALSPN